jgi:ABC-type branched-subunit amino acid transport system substrate-binding protein
VLPPEEAEAASLRRGAELGVAMANRLPGRLVQLIVRGRPGQWGDDGSETARLVLDDEAAGLILPPGGAGSHLAMQVSGRTAIPAVTLCGDTSISGAGVPWVAQVVPDTVAEARALCRDLPAVLGSNLVRWALVVPGARPGREALKDLRAGLQAEKQACFAETTWEGAGSNLATVVQATLAARPDAILLWLEPAAAGRCGLALRRAGFTGVLAGSGRLWQSRQLTAACAPVWMPLPALREADVPAARALQQEWAKTQSGVPDQTTALACDAVGLLLVARREEEPNPPVFPPRQPLPGATGPLAFDAFGRRLVTWELGCHDGREFVRGHH